MASSIVMEFEADFLMDLFAELPLLAARRQPAPGNDIAINLTTEETMTDEQFDETPKMELENIAATPSTLDLITALSSTSIGNSEPEAENTAPPSTNNEEASGIQNTDDTSRTEPDVIGFSLMSDDQNKAQTGLTKNLITAPPSAPAVGYSDLEANNTIPASSYIEEASNIQNTDYTLHTDADGIGFSLIADDDDDGPQIMIESEGSLFNIRLIVIVSMITPFADSFESIIHTGDFILDVNPATRIRDIKYGITGTLEICYEDMALLFIGKFLSDSRTLQHYMIDDGQTLHLLVETSNKLFKDVFETFKRLNLNEEKAWFASKGFINVMHDKYGGDGFGNDEAPEITEELLLHELQQLFVPDSDSDDSDDSTADDNEPEIINQNVVQLGGIELELVNQAANQVTAENETEDNSENEDQNSDDEEQHSEDDYSSDDEDETDDDNEDDNFDFIAQVLAHFASVELFE